MYIGIDLGTSGVKVILLDSHDKILASQTQPLTVSRPYELWSEQEPNRWWDATCDVMDKLSEQVDLSKVEAIGLSGKCMVPLCLMVKAKCFAQQFYGMTAAVLRSANNLKNLFQIRAR